MRRVVGNLQDLGIDTYSNITIEFTLVNRFDKPISVQTENTFTVISKSSYTTTSDTSGNFACEILENSHIKRMSYYRCAIGDLTPFLFVLPQGQNDANLLCLVNQIDYDGVLNITETTTGDSYTFNEAFIAKIDRYLMGKEVYFSSNEEKLLDKYTAYIHNTSSRCADIDALDKHLATIGV